MTEAALETLLYQQIPSVTALEVRVVQANPNFVEIMAPLAPNRNHRGTAFGGSLSTILILSGYAWLFNLLDSRGLNGHVILKSSEVKFLKPVTEEIHAIAKSPPPLKVEEFTKVFEKKGRARIFIEATVSSQKTAACLFKGEFVATIEGLLAEPVKA